MSAYLKTQEGPVVHTRGQELWWVYSHVVTACQQQNTWVRHTSVEVAARLPDPGGAPGDSCCYACQQMAINGQLATCPDTGQHQGQIPCTQPRAHTISHVALSRPSPEQRSLVPSQSTGSSHCPSSATATEQLPTYPRDSTASGKQVQSPQPHLLL